MLEKKLRDAANNKSLDIGTAWELLAQAAEEISQMRIDRRDIDWKLGWIDRRRHEIKAEMLALDQQERDYWALRDHQGVLRSMTPDQPKLG